MKKSNLIPKQKYIRRRTVDEKKVREVIDELKSLIYVRKRTLAALPTSARKDSLYNNEITALETAIGALEKQLPKKPIIKSEKEVPRTHNLGRLLRFHCPNCGRFIAGMYETDVERGGGISNRLKGCSTCLQAIDFSEYYSNANKDKPNDEIQWDE